MHKIARKIVRRQIGTAVAPVPARSPTVLRDKHADPPVRRHGNSPR